MIDIPVDVFSIGTNFISRSQIWGTLPIFSGIIKENLQWCLWAFSTG